MLKLRWAIYADQQENVIELYQMQSETKSLVNIDENFERKNYHQYTVEVYQYYSRVDFQSLSARCVHHFIDWERVDGIPAGTD